MAQQKTKEIVMYIISLTYKTDLEKVDRYIPEHMEFLKKHYQDKKFLVSGRKTPRTGGMIIATATDRQEIEDIIKKDPFYENGIADYEIIEITPTMADERLNFLITQPS